MRIGLLTFHRAINYGAVLQCYALAKTLASLGHEVQVIDYRQPRVERTDRRRGRKHEKLHLLFGLHLRSWWLYDKCKDRHDAEMTRFDQFLYENFTLTRPCVQDNIPVDFDVYVVGSDQVWNSEICAGVDSVYWGDFQRASGRKLIAYAVSTSVSDLASNDHVRMARYMAAFSAISVREASVAQYLNTNFKLVTPVRVTLDPVLLASGNIWQNLDTGEYGDKDYVFYFSARSCVKRPNVIREKAERLSKIMGCTTVSIDFGTDSPRDFITKIMHAKAVVSSSFHGVAFSLVFNKMLFAVQYGDEQDGRYSNLLHSLSAEQMLTFWDEDVEKPYCPDYSVINGKLDEIRKNSFNYIREI